MFTLLKEHRYFANIGVETVTLRVEELLSGTEGWPDMFRLRIAAGLNNEARIFYGKTHDQVASDGAEFLYLRRQARPT